MPPKKRTRKEETETMEKPMEQGEDKKEVARQLLKGDGVEKKRQRLCHFLKNVLHLVMLMPC